MGRLDNKVASDESAYLTASGLVIEHGSGVKSSRCLQGRAA